MPRRWRARRGHVPTALSSTETPTSNGARGRVAAARRAVEDVAILFRFRAQAVRRRHLTRGLVASFVLVTLTIAILPAFLPGAQGAGKAFDIFLLMPSAMAGILALNVASAIASGGGRELISRDQAAPYPISPTTDHLGALVLAPLNIAWMIQAWILLGAMAYSFGPTNLLQAQVVILLWLVFATTLGQVVAWTMESVRRGPFGIGISRGLLVCLGLAAGVVQLTGHTTDLLDQIPTLWFFQGAVGGWGLRWWVALVVLLVGSTTAVAAGAVPTHLAARRMPRDEARMETDQHEPRPVPRTVLGLLIRADRASVWRSVPMRRGVLVLAIGPGLVAVFGNLPWSSMTILPGLVASGGALLFGVNTWCLDGRGALWRDSLPVSAAVAYYAKVIVLFEVLIGAAGLTIVLASLRAGVPTSAELASAVSAAAVVAMQVVAAAMRWSVERPFATDMRSARATPAPPVVMAGYSARLALKTTVVGLVFSSTALAHTWSLPVLVAVPLLCWSSWRLVRTSRLWAVPEVRS